jgi:DNA ligase-1
MQRRDLPSRFFFGYLGCLATPHASASTGSPQPSDPPPLWLANTYSGHENITHYWVSEKFDGIRGYWDGSQLLSRSGRALNPPTWFVQGWPDRPLEGELWAGLGQFEHAASIIQQKQASDNEWRTLRFMVFDMPTPNKPFTERISLYQSVVRQIDKPWLQAVEQSQIQSHSDLKTLLQKTVQAGGEGLVLHRGSSNYQRGRSDDVLKVKLHQDAEAKVVGYEAGQGKHMQRTGALWVETEQGLRFKLGTGLADAQRENPPAVGQWVSYRYRGLTDKGVPRFASFVRIRPAIER